MTSYKELKSIVEKEVLTPSYIAESLKILTNSLSDLQHCIIKNQTKPKHPEEKESFLTRQWQISNSLNGIICTINKLLEIVNEYESSNFSFSYKLKKNFNHELILNELEILQNTMKTTKQLNFGD